MHEQRIGILFLSSLDQRLACGHARDQRLDPVPALDLQPVRAIVREFRGLEQLVQVSGKLRSLNHHFESLRQRAEAACAPKPSAFAKHSARPARSAAPACDRRMVLLRFWKS